MNNGVISLSDALEIFKTKDEKGRFVPFNIEYRTFNESTKKGGKLISYENVTYLPSSRKENKIIDDRQTNRPPKHFKNRTRNIQLINGEVKKIRIDFIISINGVKVIY